MEDETLPPVDEPAFLRKETAEAIPYDGIDAPTFDDELFAEDPDAPSPGYIDRYREVARLHAFGLRNNEICSILKYTPTRLSIILRDPFVQREIAAWRGKFVSGEAIEFMRQAARDGARRTLGIVNNPRTKDETVIRATQFAIEQTLGKPKQTIEQTQVSFVAILNEMRASGEFDVTPSAPPALAGAQEGTTPTVSVDTVATAAAADPLAAWLDQHLAPRTP